MTRPVVWTIAGSDSGGGAGIQADLATLNSLGVHGCTVITALTAQNTKGIARIEFVADDMIEAQVAALTDDLPPVAVKLGMLGTPRIIRGLAAHLRKMPVFVVCDPVMASTSGTALFAKGALEALVSDLLPAVHLLTPNIPEAEALLKRDIRTHEDMKKAAEELMKSGVKSVLLKGGHSGGVFSQDYWTDGRAEWWFTSPRKKETHTHGAGCTLSAAIAAARALGYPEVDSIVIAKAYVNQGLREGGGIGSGRGPLDHGAWPSSPKDLPWMTRTAADGRRCLLFPDCGPEPIGLYPIVDRAAWIERLLPLGVKTIQLRIKDLTGPALDHEVRAAVDIARRSEVRLFINDHWHLALSHRAYGVHLGQDDLPHADLTELAAAGLRLGISTRSFEEIARAKAVRPSYVAIGSLYATPSKSVDYQPLGLNVFRRLRKLIDVPVVAIGGITLERAPEVRAAGADGFAVISDITDAGDPEARVKDWLQFLSANPR